MILIAFAKANSNKHYADIHSRLEVYTNSQKCCLLAANDLNPQCPTQFENQMKPQVYVRRKTRSTMY